MLAAQYDPAGDRAVPFEEHVRRALTRCPASRALNVAVVVAE
jgi:hypothetical protein